MTPRGWYVWWIAGVAALGGLLFGYDWVVIGGAKPFYEAHFSLTSPSVQGWAMSCALVGCLAGAMLSGMLSEKFGRKPALLASALVFTVSSIGTGAAGTFDQFVAWRMCGGLAIGLASSLSPMYIAEISPTKPDMRGRLVCLNELTIVIGILLAQVTNWVIAGPNCSLAKFRDSTDLASCNVAWLNHNAGVGWRWMFAATASARRRIPGRHAVCAGKSALARAARPRGRGPQNPRTAGRKEEREARAGGN